MPAPEKVDVIVAVPRMSSRTLRSLQQLVEIRDPALGRLIVVVGPSVDRGLESFAQGFPKVSIIKRPDDPQGIAAWNRGLLERGGDVVLLAADTMVTPGWLTELSAVALSEERTAFAWPLSNRISGGSAREAFSGLPASTTAETTEGECVYLRGPIVDAVGLLDTSLSTLRFAVEDWVMRAQALGFFGKRANHAYVEHAEQAAPSDEASQALCATVRSCIRDIRTGRARLNRSDGAWMEASPGTPPILLGPASCPSPMTSAISRICPIAHGQMRFVWRRL